MAEFAISCITINYGIGQARCRISFWIGWKIHKRCCNQVVRRFLLWSIARCAITRLHFPICIEYGRRSLSTALRVAASSAPIFSANFFTLHYTTKWRFCKQHFVNLSWILQFRQIFFRTFRIILTDFLFFRIMTWHWAAYTI